MGEEPLVPPEPGAGRQPLLRALAWTGVTVALAVWALALGERPLDLEALLEGARLAPLAAGFILMFGGMLFMGFRWRALLPEGWRTSPWALAAMDCTGQLFNVALPGPVGELVAAFLVQRRYHIPAATALAASIHGRVVGMVVASTVALLLRVFLPLPVPGGAASFVLAALAIVVVATAGLVAVALWPRVIVLWTEAWLVPLGRRLGTRSERASRALDRGIRQFADALAGLGRGLGWPHLAAAGWATLGIGSVVLGDWLASVALGEPGSLAGLAFTHCTITAGAILLFALPLGQIGWDAAFAALLQATAGLSLPVALGVTAVVRVQQSTILVLGALFLPLLARSRGGEGLGAPGIGGPPSGS